MSKQVSQQLAEAPRLPWNRRESDLCHLFWNAMCGHHSVAAAAGLELEKVCKAFGSKKGWMSPTDVGQLLLKLNVKYRVTLGMKTKKLRAGVCRVQFEGSWLAPGVPVAAAYQHTHYIAVRSGHVLDTVVDSCLWVPLQEWLRSADEHYVSERVTGWHVTHWFEMT